MTTHGTRGFLVGLRGRECLSPLLTPGGTPLHRVHPVAEDLHDPFDHAAATWHIQALLWSEDAELTVQCTELTLDGEPITVP